MFAHEAEKARAKIKRDGEVTLRWIAKQKRYVPNLMIDHNILTLTGIKKYSFTVKEIGGLLKKLSDHGLGIEYIGEGAMFENPRRRGRRNSATKINGEDYATLKKGHNRSETAMKMSASKYAKLKTAIKRLSEYKKKRSRSIEVDMWDRLWKAQAAGFIYVIDDFYRDGITDRDINAALKKIGRELGIWPNSHRANPRQSHYSHPKSKRRAVRRTRRNTRSKRKVIRRRSRR